MIESLLKTILANPADDAVRLVYADWLEENDGNEKRCAPGAMHSHAGRAGMVIHGVLHETDPRNRHHHCDEKCWVSNGFAERAEFIRVQIELARMKPIYSVRIVTRERAGEEQSIELDSESLESLSHKIEVSERAHWPHVVYRSPITQSMPDNYQSLLYRQSELVFPNGWMRHHREWFPEFDDSWMFKFKEMPQFEKLAVVRRGWPDLIRCTWKHFLAEHAAIMAASPLTDVTLTSCPAISYCAGPCAHATIEGVAKDVPVSQKNLNNDILCVLAKKFGGIKFNILPYEADAIPI